ncbi:N-acetylmuramoyl-L-alanine amidase [Natroniella sp. ANB-PHB2]|uniref:N-acetylmuramoyl-L-alanine amidase n=1 Tax=Natroniella sp. ANB-PHB2 TaxID=3384444 RepID=UPI0038D4FB72
MIVIWEGIVVHHSASPDVSANEIDRWHREKGWKGVGYHFVIRANGDIEPARNFESAGAHARGRNQNYIGICLAGDFTKHPPTPEQISSLIHLTKGIKSRWSAEKIEKHHDNCPGPMLPWDFFIQAV